MRDINKGILGSLGIHAVLVLIFFLIKVNPSFTSPEFVEVGLLTTTRGGVVKKGTPQKKKGKEVVELPVAELGEKKEKPQGEKEIPGETEEPKYEKEIPSQGEAEGAYTIEGEISKRRIIYKLLPQYPKGQEVETKVRVRIFVAPDGRIERMVLVKKGGDIFDKITLNALREWKFEKLPPNLPQEIQEGVITFVYKLR
jgi:TonB family protein